MNPQRPHLLGLVCWVVIIACMAGIYFNMKAMGAPNFQKTLEIYPYPSWLAEVILFGTLVIPIVSAIFMYEGHGWARYVYLPVMLPYFIQNYLAIPQQKYPDFSRNILEGEFVLYLLSAVILFLPSARYFFYPPKYIDGY